ncbi:metal ABC transporter solute-binding protein, Zn/Mn family [Microbacterium sp. NIBRBAC000506063]|uniref:metal ABC transporter solute-binding protein, Zn/Mn family n=1 Tax=Microbacterium sp. NIBRBAC000506063 TaxID=2734618 RepID=UPI001CB6B7DD|nr:zinc ABC transporter substrate-binding protein [Microbacterium sp. NIBRBAC000506063]
MKRPITALAVAAASALVLAGCSSPAAEGSDPGSDLIQVVASTNVYGSLVEQVGGDRVEVTSIITSATQDPHSYEATARDRLAVQNAVLVIENGGGYDHFMETLREGAAAHVITAVEFSHDYPGEDGHGHDEEHADDHDHEDEEHGDDHDHDDHADEEHDHDHGDDHDHDDEHAEDEHADDHDDHEGHNHIEGFNEHIWFDVHTIVHVVEAIAEELGEIEPAGEAEFEAAAAALIDELEAIEAEQETLHQEFAGTGVFITEPLPGYLAEALGLVDHAPTDSPRPSRRAATSLPRLCSPRSTRSRTAMSRFCSPMRRPVGPRPTASRPPPRPRVCRSWLSRSCSRTDRRTLSGCVTR